jgi:DUF4097 and DUF4098 domain-containing protein YvlB
MMLRRAALALAITIGTALPAIAQGPRVDRDILPPEFVRDLERVIEEATIVATASVRESLRSLDLDRDLQKTLQLDRTVRRALERSPERSAQDRNRIERTDRSTRTISLGPNGLLELRNVAGDITVTVGGGRDVVIETIKQSRANSEADAARGLQDVNVTIDHRGERVVVDTTYPRGRTPYQVTTPYNVTAPAGTRLNARSVSGNITVRGITGDITVDSVSGMIRINDGGRVSQARSVSGEVQLTDLKTDGIVATGSVSGNVILQRIRARQVTGETVSGQVRADDVTADGVQIKSLSGSVEFLGPLSRNGRYELNSHSGTVRLAVSGGVGFELQARSFSGRIRPEGLSLQSISMNRGALRATVGDASAVVIAGTFSGDVVVGRR